MPQPYDSKGNKLRTWKVTESDFWALSDIHTRMKRTPGAGKVNQWDVISALLSRPVPKTEQTAAQSGNLGAHHLGRGAGARVPRFDQGGPV